MGTTVGEGQEAGNASLRSCDPGMVLINLAFESLWECHGLSMLYNQWGGKSVAYMRAVLYFEFFYIDAQIAMRNPNPSQLMKITRYGSTTIPL